MRIRPPWIVAALAVTLAACGTDDDPDESPQVQQLEQQLAAAEQDRDEVQQRVEELEAEIEQLDAEVSGNEADDEDEPASPDDPAPLRSPEGLVDQLRVHLGFEELPEGYEPGTTEWSPFELPDQVRDETHETPGEATTALLEALEADRLGQDTWEATARALLDPDDEDTAQAALLSWGWADDATIGRDVRVELERTDDDLWTLEDAEARHHCSRGVDDDRCV